MNTTVNTQKNQTWFVYTDGASRGNPGQSGAGIYVVDHNGKQILKGSFYLGRKTNNQAEYLALAFATFMLKNFFRKNTTTAHLTFMLDSELIVRQMDGAYRVKNAVLASIKQVIDKNLENVECSFKHVPRKENLMADTLANQGIDKKHKLPPKLVKFSVDHRLPL